MRFVASLMIVVVIVLGIAGPSDATQFLNRRLIECDPLTYVIEPLEIVGGTLQLTPSYSNDYGDCTGLTPGPPFIIEADIVISNERNTDGTVLNWGTLIIDNRFGAMGDMELDINAGDLICQGYVEAYGQAGAMIVFTGDGHYDFTYNAGNEYPDFTRDFSYCEIKPGQLFGGKFFEIGGKFFEIDGGHLTMDNCRFDPTDDDHGLYYSGHGEYDVVLKDCYFDGTSITNATLSPNHIGGARSMDIDGLHFENCQVAYESGISIGCLEITGLGVKVKNLTNISGNNNSHNWIVFGELCNLHPADSCTVRTTKEFPPVLFSSIIVDSNTVLSMEKGSVIQMAGMSMELKVNMYPNSSLIMDSSVITSSHDMTYGPYLPGYSSEEPSYSHTWWGIEMKTGSKLTLKNQSRLRWTGTSIYGEGNVLLDHSFIEQYWGRGIELRYTDPCSLQVIGSTIHQGLPGSDGIMFYMTIGSTDPATTAGYLMIDSSTITGCGGEGVYVGGGIGRPFDDELKVKITNSNISGNDDYGLYMYLGPPLDSCLIKNNKFIGNANDGVRLWGACDSAVSRVENSVAAGNRGSGFWMTDGLIEFVGNTSVFNSSHGIYYPARTPYPNRVANNLIAYNDGYGIYCYKDYGDVLLDMSHNIFWHNSDDISEIRVRTDEADLYTVAELQELDSISATNLELDPQLYPIYEAKILTRYYHEGSNQTKLWIEGPSVNQGDLEGLPVLPTQSDTTAWFYILRNTSDSIYLAGDAMDVLTGTDSLVVYEYHIANTSPALEYGDGDYVTSVLDIDGQSRIIDGDGNDIALVDVGADEFDPDSLGLILQVSSPIGDTTLIPGSTANIIWASSGIENVKIEYAADIQNGQSPTWQTITNSVAATPAIYSWAVPQALSYRTKVRVSDTGESGFESETDYFHIKPYCLTRVSADSTYEKFAPSSDGWSFDNEESGLWPESWWQQYDYLTGVDPYTGREYPSGNASYPFTLKPPSSFPSWVDFVEAFGVDQCYITTGNGLAYVMRAVNRWGDIAKPWGGSCFGMTNTAGLTFSHKAELASRWGDLGLPDNLYQLSISDDLRQFINVTYLSQLGQVHTDYVQAHRRTTPKEAVEQLREIFLDKTSARDAALFLANQNYTQAHSVYPYELVNDPNPWLVKLFIYDPNYSGEDVKYITIDTVNNLWEYSELFEWAGNWYMFPTEPISGCLETPQLTSSLPIYPALAKQRAEGSGAIEIVFPNDGYITARNEAGDSIGYGTEGGFVTIDSAFLLPTMQATNGLPYRMIVPDETYQFRLSKIKEDNIRVGWYYDSLYFGYSREGVDSTQVDSLLLSDGLTVVNADVDGKQIVLLCSRTLSDGERAVVIDSLDLLQDESVRLEPLDTNGWYLDNPGDSRTYRLWLRQVRTSNGEWKFSAHDIALESGVSHILTPHWSDLTHDSCTIYLDFNHDHITDDSLTLYNDIVLGINDDPSSGLPYRFSLSQNYPNPFNPVTTIEYSLPRRGIVTIEVFNVLGQRVRTLIDREESAGYYTVTWDGTTDNGKSVATGIYLYRFQAGDHVETKKMLLLK